MQLNRFMIRPYVEQALREEIAQTVSSDEEIAEEMEYLRRVLAS